MNINVVWDNPECTILRWDIKGRWTWETFLSSQQQTIDLMNRVPQKVHIIVDVSHSSRLPSGALGQFHSFRRDETPNLGRTILVGMNPLIMSAATMFLRIFPMDWGNVSFANTLQEARSMLLNDRD